jgi:hypothetical protein
MELYPVVECLTKEGASFIVSFFCEKGFDFYFVFTGNKKPYLVVTNKEGLKAFEQWNHSLATIVH